MGLDSLEKNVFIYLKSFHFYLYPFPLQWNSEYKQINILKPYSKYWGPPILVLLYTVVYAICALLTSFYISFYLNVERMEVMVQVMICCALGAPVLIIFSLLLNINIFILAFNVILRMAVQIQNGKPYFF